MNTPATPPPTTDLELVGKATGVSLIDLRAPFLDKAELFPDSVHPNDEGARLMAGKIFRALTGQSRSQNGCGKPGN